MLKLGVDYYPEHWPEERWAIDAKMMAEIGLSYVRVGEFAWSLLEPEEDHLDFDWLYHAMDILHENGLKVILGTPTATPPPWLTDKYDMFQRDQNHLVLGPGSRRHVCANNPYYLEQSKRIVTAIARYFSDHPALVGWQIDNEFSCHRTTWCFCDHCHQAFHQWLEARYETLDELNEAWGTIFWSAVYTDWGQIPLPWASSAQQNPSLQLDFRRFASDSWVDYQDIQINILRQYTPKHFITHNFMGLSENNIDQQDYFDLAAELDFVVWDNYPQGNTHPYQVALNHDFMRSFKGKDYWVMEQQPGVVNWHAYNRPVPPGQVRLWTYQGFGHGAETVVYFRWRAAQFGQEQYHMGVLKQDGSPTRLYDEAQQIANELQTLPKFSRKPAEVAILFDYIDWWSIQIDPHQQDFSYHQLVQQLYHQLWAAGISVDILRRGASAELSTYKAILIPAPILIDDADAEEWKAYVENGGRLLITFRAFVKEQENTWTDQPLPADLEPLLGIKIEEYLGLPPDITGTAQSTTDAQTASYRLWAEILTPTTAQPLFKYNDHYWADSVAATANKVGDGIAVTLGCWFDEILPPTIKQTLGLNKLGVSFDLPDKVEAISLLFEDDEEGLMLLNHNLEPVDMNLSNLVINLVGDSAIGSQLTLLPLAVSVLKFA